MRRIQNAVYWWLARWMNSILHHSDPAAVQAQHFCVILKIKMVQTLRIPHLINVNLIKRTKSDLNLNQTIS